jgi:hypothetical protein
MRALSEGRDPGAEKVAARKAVADTVEAVVEEFLERHVRANNRPKTVEEAERTLRNRIVRAWGKRKVGEIGRKDIVRLLDGIVGGPRRRPTAPSPSSGSSSTGASIAGSLMPRPASASRRPQSKRAETGYSPTTKSVSCGGPRRVWGFRSGHSFRRLL